jgi:uncharacterized membrane protein YgcG
VDPDDLLKFAIPAFIAAVVVWALYSNVRAAHRTRADKERNEAMFVSMFPELQPHFHPRKLVEFVKWHRATKPAPTGRAWPSPAGFAVHDALIAQEKGKTQVRLRDAAGKVLGQFQFEHVAEGGVLRVGKGKLTVNVRDAVPRVRYWHPDREFKWSEPKGWTFVTRMSDEPFSSNSSSDSSSSSSSSSSWSDSSRTAAAAGAAGVAVAGAGGAFDGGGASQAWDDAGSGSGASADTSASTTSY